MYVMNLLNNSYKNHYLISELVINYLAVDTNVKNKKTTRKGGFFVQNYICEKIVGILIS